MEMSSNGLFGPFKKYVAGKMAFFEPFFPHVTLCNYFLKAFSTCAIYKRLANYTLKQKISVYGGFNLFGNSLLHIGTKVLINRVDKMVEFNALDLVI